MKKPEENSLFVQVMFILLWVFLGSTATFVGTYVYTVATIANDYNQCEKENEGLHELLTDANEYNFITTKNSCIQFLQDTNIIEGSFE